MEVGTATLYITENNVIWGGGESLNGVPSPAIQLLYPTISMHAVQRTPSPALYLVINYELRLPGHEAADAGDDDEDNEFDGEEAYTQIRFVPQNENDLQAMYNAMSQGQTMNPDPNQSPDEDEDHYMDGEEFEEAAGEDEFEDAEESNMSAEDAVQLFRQMRLKNGHPQDHDENEDAGIGE